MVMGIDIGSSEICVAICEVDYSGELNLLSIGTSVTRGLTKGLVQDTVELQRSVERAIKRAERDVSVCPSRVITNVPPFGIQFAHNMGLLLSKEETGQIGESDKIECIRRSKNVAKLSEQKLLHVIPLVFKVDGTLVQNPVGVFGKTLEVQTQLIFGQATSVFSITKILKTLNLQINGLMYDMLGTAQICLSEEERKSGAILIDLGGKFTKIGIFKNNLLHRSFIIPIGGDTFTSDIAACLKVGLPEAERLKVLEGNVLISESNQDETIEISTLNEGRKEIKRLLLNQILEARLQELLRLINTELTLRKYEGYTCILCGGGGLLSGVLEHMKKAFRLKTRYGVQEAMQPIIDNPLAATAIGLIVYGIKTNAIPVHQNTTLSINATFKKWIKHLF
jgi:cell division protein FtsA